MASREYDLLFRLTAQIDSAFSGSFSTARTVMSELQGELNGYKDTLRDISAYQQQQDALKNLESTLDQQKQKLDEVRAALQKAREEEQKAGIDEKELAAAKKQHEQAIDALKTKLQQQKTELSATNAALKNEKATIAELRAALKQEGADTEGLTAKIKEHEAQAEQLTVKKKAQEAAVAATTAELQKEKTELSATDAALKTHKENVGQLEEREKALQSDVESLSSKLTTGKAALEQQAAALREAGIDTTNLEKEIERLGTASDNTKQKMESWQGMVNRIGDLSKTFSSLRMAADWALEGVDALTNGIESSVQAAAGLEYSMDAVRGISGASDSEMQQLNDLVREQGRTTVFTAQEAADALQKEALAGWEVSDMIAGLPAVVSLAAAAGEDLESMSSIVSDALNAFGLDGQAAVNKFADVLVKGATSSNTTVSLLGESLSYVETTAGNMGYSIEDVTLALAQMANNALKGGVAGSALNTMLTRMSGANANAKKEMDRLGLSMYDGMGNAKPLLQFLNELRGAFQNMSGGAQEAQISAYKLAGQRGMRGLLALVNSSDEEWEKLTNDIYSYSGAAKTIADIRLDNYTGQVQLLSDAWTDLQITIGNAFLPVATEGAGILTELINGVNGLVETMPSATTGFGAFLYVLQGGLKLVSGMSMPIMALNSILQTTSITLSTIGTAATGGVFAAGMAGIIVAGTAAFQRARQDLVGELEAANKAYDDSMAEYQETLDGITAEKDDVSGLVGQLQELAAQSNRTAGEKARLARIVDELNSKVPGLNLAYNEESDVLTGLTDNIGDYVEAMYEAKMMEAKSNFLVDQYGNIKNLERELALAEDAYEDYKKTATEAMLAGEGEGWVGTFQDASYQEEIAEAKRNLDEAQTLYNETEAEVKSYMEAQRAAAGETADVSELSVDSVEAIAGAVDNLKGAYQELYKETLESVRGQYDIWDSVEEVAATSMENLMAAAQSQLTYWTNYQSNMQTIRGAIAELQGQNVDTSGLEYLLQLAAQNPSEEAAGAIAGIAEAVKNGNTEELKTYNSTLAEVLGAQAEVADTLAEEKSALDEGVQEAVQAVNDVLDAAENREQAYNAMIELLGGMEDGLADSESIAIVTATLETAEAEWVSGLTTELSPDFMSALGTDAMAALQGGIDGEAGGVRTAASNAASGAVGAVSNLLNWSNGHSAGANYGAGIVAGLRSQVDAARTAARALASASHVSVGSSSGSSGGRKYAKGTAYAEPGIAEVGENGPELMMFAGGERVWTAQQTASILAMAARERDMAAPAAVAPQVTIPAPAQPAMKFTYAPSIQMAPGNDENSLRRQLLENEAEFREMIEDYMERREAQQRRRRY